MRITLTGPGRELRITARDMGWGERLQRKGTSGRKWMFPSLARNPAHSSAYSNINRRETQDPERTTNRVDTPGDPAKEIKPKVELQRLSPQSVV